MTMTSTQFIIGTFLIGFAPFLFSIREMVSRNQTWVHFAGSPILGPWEYSTDMADQRIISLHVALASMWSFLSLYCIYTAGSKKYFHRIAGYIACGSLVLGCLVSLPRSVAPDNILRSCWPLTNMLPSSMVPFTIHFSVGPVLATFLLATSQLAGGIWVLRKKGPVRDHAQFMKVATIVSTAPAVMRIIPRILVHLSGVGNLGVGEAMLAKEFGFLAGSVCFLSLLTSPGVLCNNNTQVSIHPLYKHSVTAKLLRKVAYAGPFLFVVAFVRFVAFALVIGVDGETYCHEDIALPGKEQLFCAGLMSSANASSSLV